MRANNEDNFGYDLERQIFLLCDGMGGEAAGETDYPGARGVGHGRAGAGNSFRTFREICSCYVAMD